ncbi:MAG TPA: competence/damage-inducible protein A [Deinococcales bacterium]|nr:competence/damage-inducible protein A [Deinococcales bacterium]
MVTLVAELISVGTELLLGEIVDTNAAYLAQELKNRGVNLYWKTVVGDNQERVVEAIERALTRSDIVIVGGGLGPTEDDLSREAIAAVAGETPTVDEAALAHLREFFRSRGREMPATNTKQAWLIPSAEALPNPNGTAPGWLVRTRGKVIVALPGPPFEMKPMWSEQVLPRLALPQAGLHTRTFRTTGIGESHIAELLGSQLTGARNPSVATYARRDGVHVRVAASAATADAARELAAPAEAAVLAALDEYVYGTDGDDLAVTVGRQLAARSETVATMESLTGGLVADEITNVPGSSGWLVGGAVPYAARAKIAMGVSAETIEQHGTVSRETAREMAAAARERFAATWGVATTGVAGPDSSEGKPVGLAYLAVSGPGVDEVSEIRASGGRRTVKERAAIAALALLWRSLRRLEAGQ